jgi:hypothetical protein
LGWKWDEGIGYSMGWGWGWRDMCQSVHAEVGDYGARIGGSEGTRVKIKVELKLKERGEQIDRKDWAEQKRR